MVCMCFKRTFSQLTIVNRFEVSELVSRHSQVTNLLSQSYNLVRSKKTADHHTRSAVHRLSSNSLHRHNILMNQMRVPILQADEMILDRIRFRAFEHEELSALHTVARDLAAHCFSDKFCQ